MQSLKKQKVKKIKMKSKILMNYKKYCKYYFKNFRLCQEIIMKF